MTEVINHRSVKKARKRYVCDACRFINDHSSFSELASIEKLTFSEKRSLVKAKQSRQND